MLKRLNIALEEDLHSKVKAKAIIEKTTMENIIAQALNSFLNNGGSKKHED